MENYTFLALLSSSSLLVLYCLVKASYFLWWKPKYLEKQLRRQGIRGTPYKLLTGDVKDLIKLVTEAWSKPMNLVHDIVPRVDPFTHHIVQKYGKVSFCWMGTAPKVIISDPEAMQEVLLNKLGHFGKPELSPLILILTRGLTTLEGQEWATRRRIINPAFHQDKLKGMLSMFTDSCEVLIEKWSKSISQQETCEIDVSPEFQKLTGDIISRTAFGSNFEEGEKILELQKELQVLVVETMQSLYIPGLRFLPTKKNQRRKQLDKEITSILRTLVERKERDIRTGKSRSDDLLGLLLQSNNQQNSEEGARGTKSNGMTISEVIEECKQFYLAGHETTASLLTWTMIVLAIHPDWQEKARNEVKQICGIKLPDFESISRLKIMTMIIHEVQRLYPTVIAHYPHVYKETKIGNIYLPAGVDVTLPTLLIHHDPELWGEDAEEFKPERFSEGVSKASKDKLAFFPFGWGPRTCIGQNFAMIEVKVAVTMILQHFSFVLSPSYTHAPHTVMTLQPQHGAQVILHKL